MRSITRRESGTDVSPWRELEAMSDRMRRWPDYPFLGPSLFKTPLLAEASEWMPAVELVEEDGEFLLTAELPGLSKDDVELSVDDGVLTLKGEKKLEHEREEGRAHIRERQYGAFERSFTLPRNVDAEKIKADFRDGIVEVHLPKGEEAKAKRIEIK